MNESAIKNYSTWARRELIAEVERRCAMYGITAEKDCPLDIDSVGGQVLTSLERKQRRELVIMARNGMDALVERAAYTWFNRILAIRFMECNDRLPSQTRMFSAADGSFSPQVLREALSVEIDGVDRAHVASLLQTGDDEALFRYLFLLQCDELAACMPSVFDKMERDPLTLLLPDGLLRPESVIGRIVDDIDEADWRDGVQIVGWMYQFYISEKKDEFYASKRKAAADDIPAATQLFTPEWIVQYLVQNSLGRLWMLNHPESHLVEQMDYFISPDGDARGKFQHVGSPEEITLIDPACGSGHILVYAFDLLAAIYEECGYSRRDIPRLILEKNLTGIEIDHRAGALASFALTMKACEYDGRFLRRGIQPKITVLEKIELEQEHIDAINAARVSQAKHGEPFLLERVGLLDALSHLDEIGSLFAPTSEDMAALHTAATSLEAKQGLFGVRAQDLIAKAFGMLGPLSRKYAVVVANPPYMANSSMNSWMSNWVKSEYPDTKSDTFSAFIARNCLLCHDAGELGFMTPFVWMFITSYEQLRRYLIHEKTITSLIQLEYSGFAGATVPICAFTLNNCHIDDYRGGYVRLSDFVGPSNQAPKAREAISNPECGWFYRADTADFELIPGAPISYWANEPMREAYTTGTLLREVADLRVGLQTGKNNVFLRLWWEIAWSNVAFGCGSSEEARMTGCRWFPYNKGGHFRKWYGNFDYVINWYEDGKDVRTCPGAVIRNPEGYFKQCVTWTDITSSGTHFRYRPEGSLYDVKGMSFFAGEQESLYLLAFCNSSVAAEFLKVLAPTLSTQVGDVGRLPIVDCPKEQLEVLLALASDCIEIARIDWDAFETSWDFARHPLLKKPASNSEAIATTFRLWEEECLRRFTTMKSNEEEINRIITLIYGMDEKAPIVVPDEKISVRIADKTRDVKSLVSYAVGCMFGRYSLDVDGVVLASQGDGLAEYLAKVPKPTFTPDDDGIIPITDTEYFHDDATGFFVDFVRTAYGAELLEENLAFVADALGGSGTPREVIREYFMNGFFADHCKVYQKRPIYWLFDSGKKGGFRALVYMHRYKPDLLAKLRTDYVHEQQDRYRTQIEHIDDALESADRRQQAELKKRRKKLAEQLAEIGVFEEKVHHLADQMIEIDLDDGVSANYAKFQDVLAKIK